MATKQYLNIANNPYVPGTPKGAWDSLTSTLTVPMGSAPFGEGITTVGVGESTIVSPFSVLLLRAVSSKLQVQTISGTFDLILGVNEGGSDSDLFWHVHIWVSQGNTDLVRGTLLNNYKETTNEWIGGFFVGTGIGLAAPVALNPVNALAGDRIIIELGYVSRNLTASTAGGTLYYGSKIPPLLDPATDLTVGSNLGSTQAGTITFSQDILFESVPSRVAHVINQALDEAASATARNAHILIQTTQKSLSTARIAHILIQVAQGTPTPVIPGIDLSGIYTIEPNKTEKHDSYYENIERKIPNPTIRTALIGE